MANINKNQEYAKRKLVTKLRKKDVPAAPQRADMPEYEDTTEYEQYQARDENDINQIDPESNLPYKDVAGVEESFGPDDLLGPGELKAGAAALKGLVAKGAPMMVLGSLAKTGAPKRSTDAIEKLVTRETKYLEPHNKSMKILADESFETYKDLMKYDDLTYADITDTFKDYINNPSTQKVFKGIDIETPREQSRAIHFYLEHYGELPENPEELAEFILSRSGH